MSLMTKINDDLKNAMKERNKEKVSALRMLISSLKYEKIEQGKELGDNDIVSIIQREIKKRRDSAEQYRAGNREELALAEEREIEIFSLYLPKQMSDEEIEDVVKSVIEKLGASSPKDMGKVMKEIMPLLKGKADGKKINEIVKHLLG